MNFFQWTSKLYFSFWFSFQKSKIIIIYIQVCEVSSGPVLLSRNKNASNESTKIYFWIFASKLQNFILTTVNTEAHKVVSKLTSKLYFTYAKSGRNTALAITYTFLWISKTVIYRLRSIEFCNNKWIVSIYHKSYSVHFTSNIFEYFCSINIHFWMNWIYFKPALYITIMF